MLALRCEEYAFQLTACIGFLKEGGSAKTQERILWKCKNRYRE